MRGLALLVTAVLAALVGSSSAAAVSKVTVMSATCKGASGPFPNPASCSSFLQCEPSGRATVMPCPATLEFNPKLRVCDFPERAGCFSSSPPDGDDSSDSSDSSSSSGSGGDSGASGGSGAGSGEGGAPPAPPSGDAPSCPPWNPDDVTQLPNPSDCSSFYKCDENGVAWLIPCPPGLQYNAQLRVCDYPEGAGCSA